MPRVKVEGYEQFGETITQLEEKNTKDIFILFSGSKDSEGVSWCPDCVAAEPVIDKIVKGLEDKIHFVYVSVGTKEEWKNPMSSFRKDSRLKLKCVPTLLRWGKSQRLEEEECTNVDLVKMIFEDED